MNNIDISVIVPVYKVEKYLSRCIESVLNQTFKNFELILVDDGSPDNSGAICDEYAKKDSRIKVVHKQNGGVSSARNAGIKIAQGEFINFIDSDDAIPNDSLENLIKVQKENDADFVSCVIEIYNTNHEVNKYKSFNKFINFMKTGLGEEDIFLSTIFRGPCAKLFKNDIVKSCNILFDESVRFGEDTIFVYEYLAKCKNAQCSDMVVYKYMRNGQSATSKPYEDLFKYMIKVSKAQVNFFNELKIDNERKNRCSVYAIIYNLESVANQYIKSYSYERTIETVEEVYFAFKEYFSYSNKAVETFLRELNGAIFFKIYKMLVSKNGLKKYCKYKLKQKRINNFKVRLKKIRLINDLNNWIKRRKNKTV